MRVQMPRWVTFGRLARLMTVVLGSIVAAALAGKPVAAADKPVMIVALGDSLTAGLGLAAKDAFPARLQAALAAKGIAATIADAGVSGDTTSGGLARLDWSVPPGTEGVILELGANDALRGLDPKVPRASLDAILQRLAARGIPVLLCGMLSPPNLGALAKGHADEGTHRGVVYSLAPSPLDANILWAGTDDGLIWVTRDGGKNWSNVTPPGLTPWSKVAQLDASHFDDGTVYAAVNALRLDDSKPHIFRTHDEGSTWKEIVHGLPDSPVNTVREDPVRKGLLFAGTETATYV